MRTRLLIGLAVLILAGCGGDADGTDVAAPAPTVTVTETVTETASPDPGTSPQPPAPGEPGDICADVTATGGEQLGFIFVTSPRPGESVQPGFQVAGCSNTFEATFQWELLDDDGAELASDFGTASCGSGCVGDFSFTVDYVIDAVQVGALRVFSTSPKDGDEGDLNVVPLRLEP